MFNFKMKGNYNVLDSLVKQQEDNSEIIDELISKNCELIDQQAKIVDDIIELVESQQKAIRNLQKNLLDLQKLSKNEEEETL